MATSSSTRQSGFFLQSSFGTWGNFELVLPCPAGGLAHWYRDNNASGYPWIGPKYFGSGFVEAVCVIQTTDDALQVIAHVGDRLAAYSRSGPPHFIWTGPTYFATGVSGNPALIATAAGPLVLVTPAAGGGLACFTRDGAPDTPWSAAQIVGSGLGAFDAVALVQTSLGNGVLEVIGRQGTALFAFSADPALPLAWNVPAAPLFFPAIPGGAVPTGVPALCQGHHGIAGNLELAVPVSSGELAHYWRDNDDPLQPWHGPTLVPASAGGTGLAASLFQSEMLGTPGNLELAVLVGGCAELSWREESEPFAWHGPSAALCEPAPDPALGIWTVPYSASIVGIHGAVLHTGKVLLFGYKEHEDQALGDSVVLDPDTGDETRFTMDKNPFCAGQTILPDGQVLVAGGTGTGVGALRLFTPVGSSGSWQDAGPMVGDRWYPTCTILPDGRAAIMSGTDAGGGPEPGAPVNASIEIFNPAVGLAAPIAAPFLTGVSPYSTYPFVFVLPSGELLVHVNTQTFFLDPATGGVSGTILSAGSPSPRTYPLEGTAVLLLLSPLANPPFAPRVLLIAGGNEPLTLDTPASASCELLDLGQVPLAWQPAAPLASPRVMPDGVLLPDGTVLVVNGSSDGYADNGISPVLTTERYAPATDTWQTLAPMRVPRLYHATAFLLPDARVMTTGTDEDFNPHPFHYPEKRIEIFSPPYLFSGPRPTIASAPASVAYGEPFAVETPDAAIVASGVMIRPAAVTHSFNMDQRGIQLPVDGATAGSVTFTAPPSPEVAPQGFYMLFLLSDQGVPSVATFLHIPA